mgnify:CR=1 FL=1
MLSHFILLLSSLSRLASATISTVSASSSAADSGADYLSAVQASLSGSGLERLAEVLDADRSLAAAAVSSTGATALHFAAARGKVALATLLLSHGAEASAKTSGGATPLSMACASVQLELCALLIDYGAKPEPSCGAAALHAAVSRSNHELVETLLSRGGASPSVADSEDGSTPLHIASITGDASIASLLLKHGASHEARYKDSGEQPLHVAAIKGNAAVARVLLAAGARLEATSASEQTSLHAAAMHSTGDDLSVLTLLVESGARVDARHRLGVTALHELAARGLAKGVELLLANGAEADAADAYGDTALTWAASRGHLEATRILIEVGNATLVTNHFGSNALHAAAFTLHTEVIDVICGSTASLSSSCESAKEATDAFGATPRELHEATARLTAEAAAAANAHEQQQQRTFLPPLPPDWAAAAARMVSPSERKLLVDGLSPEAIPADSLIRELALAKQSLTFDRRVRTMLNSTKEKAVLEEQALLDARACEALIRAVDARASLRNGTTDTMPEHTLHIETREGLETLIGKEQVDALWELPIRYKRQSASETASAAAATRPGGAPLPRIIEIFIRRFSARTRPWIKMHADVASVTVNVALTDDGVGADDASGRLLAVYDGKVRAVARRAGDATVHASSLVHGVSRMHGASQRYTLILFFAT